MHNDNVAHQQALAHFTRFTSPSEPGLSSNEKHFCHASGNFSYGTTSHHKARKNTILRIPAGLEFEILILVAVVTRCKTLISHILRNGQILQNIFKINPNCEFAHILQ